MTLRDHLYHLCHPCHLDLLYHDPKPYRRDPHLDHSDLHAREHGNRDSRSRCLCLVRAALNHDLGALATSSVVCHFPDGSLCLYPVGHPLRTMEYPLSGLYFITESNAYIVVSR